MYFGSKCRCMWQIRILHEPFSTLYAAKSPWHYISHAPSKRGGVWIQPRNCITFPALYRGLKAKRIVPIRLQNFRKVLRWLMQTLLHHTSTKLGRHSICSAYIGRDRHHLWRRGLQSRIHHQQYMHHCEWHALSCWGAAPLEGAIIVRGYLAPVDTIAVLLTKSQKRWYSPQWWWVTFMGVRGEPGGEGGCRWVLQRMGTKLIYPWKLLLWESYNIMYQCYLYQHQFKQCVRHKWNFPTWQFRKLSGLSRGGEANTNRKALRLKLRWMFESWVSVMYVKTEQSPA